MMAGFKVIYNKITDLNKAFLQEADDIIGTAAFMVVDHAQGPAPEGAPVDTGTLSGMIFAEHEEGSLEATAHSQAEYSGYVNYGTVHMAANPYFDRAIAHASAYFYPEMAKIGGKLKNV
jgi:hypothetical protein